jgi:hypothetical protein
MADHFDVLTPHTGDLGNLTWQLCCPNCGSDVVDRSVYGGYGGDHDAVAIEPDKDDYVSPIGTRGGFVQIDLVCSASHRFNLIIANHKGAEFIGVVSASLDAPNDEGD